ncbi:MAG: hypothetical protein WED33_11150 [Bacteroidia bacterium]
MDTSEKKEERSFSNRNLTLIYLNADIGSVFDSQVAYLLKSISETAAFDRIIHLCGVKNQFEQERVSKALISLDIEVVFFKSYPNYPFYNGFQQRAILDAFKQAKAPKESHIHIRGELLASTALKPIMHVFYSLDNVVVDIRGAGREELSLYLKAPFWKVLLKKQNYRKAFERLKKFPKISVVSDALKRYILLNAQIPNSRIHVVHCLAGEHFTFNEENRKRIRNALHVKHGEKLLVFSSGGNAGWQNTQGLMLLLSDKWTILNLSKEVINEGGIINKFIPYSEVPDYLNAADAAIIFREKNIVNEVACPVKFCEYVCSGLPVISDTSVEEIVQYVNQSGSGLILENATEINSVDIDDLVDEDRKHAAKQGRITYGEGTIIRDYLNLYFN